MSQPLRKRSSLPYVLVGLAIVVLLVGAGTAWRQWRGNQAADRQAAQNQAAANSGHATGSNPSTIKPKQSAFDSYKVAADLPRYISIPKIGVNAMVKQVGLTKAGAIAAPNNVYDSAWYIGSAKPGRPGVALIDGHVSSWTTKGVFYGLKNLKAGDEVKIERGDGTMLAYRVTKLQTYDADKLDMNEVLTPTGSGKSELSLITCSGNVVKGTNEFDQRTVVFAEQQ